MFRVLALHLSKSLIQPNDSLSSLFSHECLSVSSRFVFRSDTLTYNLRDSDGTFAIPQPRTNYCKRSLSYNGVVLWNSLPLNIRQSLSLNEFKSKLKNYDFDGSLI